MSETENRTLTDQFMLRMPEGMRDRIRAAAKENHRSSNAEIVAVLEAAFPPRPEAAEGGPSLRPTAEDFEETNDALARMREAFSRYITE